MEPLGCDGERHRIGHPGPVIQAILGQLDPRDSFGARVLRRQDELGLRRDELFGLRGRQAGVVSPREVEAVVGYRGDRRGPVNVKLHRLGLLHVAHVVRGPELELAISRGEGEGRGVGRKPLSKIGFYQFDSRRDLIHQGVGCGKRDLGNGRNVRLPVRRSIGVRRDIDHAGRRGGIQGIGILLQCLLVAQVVLSPVAQLVFPVRARKPDFERPLGKLCRTESVEELVQARSGDRSGRRILRG